MSISLIHFTTKVFIVSGIPSGHSNMKIKVDITGTTGMQIGSCIIGNGTRIGALQHGSVLML